MPRFFAKWPLRHYLVVVTAFALSCAFGSLLAQGETPQKLVKADAPPQELFAAIEAGDLEVGVVPRDARRLTIQLKNKTDRPLTIQMPPALAAAPVLAQQPWLFPGGQPNNQQNAQNNQQAPQQLGLGGGQGNNRGGGGNNPFPQGIFNIPAGRAIKIKADCVCLEHGKPEPDARMKYELRPLAEVCDRPELATVLRSLGDELIDQRVAQAAAWHLTNDLSWDKLANLLRREAGAYKEMQFSNSEVAAAKRLVEKLKEQSRATATRASTAAR